MVRPLSNDSRYSEWLENTFHSADFVRNLSYLMLAFKVALETKVPIILYSIILKVM